MTWHKQFRSENRKGKTLSTKEGLFNLFEEVLKESTSSLSKEQASLLSEDFFNNTLSEIFSGIDYTNLRSPSKIQEQTDLAEDEDISAQEIKLGLPKLRISEDWGVPESRDRQIIESFTNSIPGETLEAKLDHINNVATGKVQLASVGDILSTMVVLEVLSTILSQFTEAAGGFIFEGFLAGLFGKGSVQITDVEDEDEATGKPITDVQLGDREYSLKLLNPTTAVKGSWRNMVEHFAGGRDHVVYLDARRSGSGASDSLLFSEFEITLANYIQVFYEPFKKFVRATKNVENKEELVAALEDLGDRVFQVKFSEKVGGRNMFPLRGKKGEQLKPRLMSAIQAADDLPSAVLVYSEEDYTKSVKATRLFGSASQFNAVQAAIESGNKEEIIAALRKTAGYINKAQFEFTPAQAKSIANEREIAYVQLGDEQLKKTWLLYGDIMRKTITPVYTFLGRFNENVSKYFLGTQDGDARKEYAMVARNDLASLKQATDEAIESIEKEQAAE